MNGRPVPAVPCNVVSSALTVIGSPENVFGIPRICESRPPSLGRETTGDSSRWCRRRRGSFVSLGTTPEQWRSRR